MYKILNNWWGWLLFIVIVRIVFSIIGEPIATPEEQTIQTLIHNLQLPASQQNHQELSEKILRESIQALPRYRELIITELNKAVENAPENQSLAIFAQSIEESPFFRLYMAVEKPNFPIIIYLEPLLIAIPFLYVVFLLVMPLFLEYVIGPRSTIKLYGKKGKKWIRLFTVVFWSLIVYLLYEKLYLYAHISITTISLLFLLLLIRKNMLKLFLNIRQSLCWTIFVFATITVAVSFLPYFSSLFISSAEDIKISQERVHEAIVSLKEEEYQRAMPLLQQIIQNPVYQVDDIICQILKIMATSNQEMLVMITPYLNHPKDNVRKQAMETILAIIKKEK